ncbi:hypothetical protein JG688_00010219 [Phytophthora aleatoria]|uniref:Uncharacterized protein n=1 Tax=Phytophthora aleatoria TaxID=2496075 RepID=A0A8J5IJH2_9STRA|nr:hypothetical protein JG688_00010219 [Phytophthora aleatoria]
MQLLVLSHCSGAPQDLLACVIVSVSMHRKPSAFSRSLRSPFTWPSDGADNGQGVNCHDSTHPSAQHCETVDHLLFLYRERNYSTCGTRCILLP